MTEPEEIYSAPISPDLTSAKEVLAFLLVQAEAFISKDDGPEVAEAIRDMLHDAPRSALLAWKSEQEKRRRRAGS